MDPLYSLMDRNISDYDLLLDIELQIHNFLYRDRCIVDWNKLDLMHILR